MQLKFYEHEVHTNRSVIRLPGDLRQFHDELEAESQHDNMTACLSAAKQVATHVYLFRGEAELKCYLYIYVETQF